MKNETISQDLLRSLALMQHNGEDYFILDGIAYKGNEKEIHAEWIECTEKLADAQNWDEYVIDNCEIVEELDPEDYNNDYLVLTDEEANEKCAENIKDSLWAFNASFIIDHSKLPYDAIEMVQGYQESKCEGANDTIEALIDDIDTFIEDAISADGRGHFINTYDGEENEETVNGETFYIYRIN